MEYDMTTYIVHLPDADGIVACASCTTHALAHASHNAFSYPAITLAGASCELHFGGVCDDVVIHDNDPENGPNVNDARADHDAWVERNACDAENRWQRVRNVRGHGVNE